MRVNELRIGIVTVCAASIVAFGAVCSGDVVKVPVTERKVAVLPKGPAVEGLLPRPVLMVKLQERGEFPGDRTVSSFWVFDPAASEKGLRRVFSGPGQGQYVRFLTPLYGGYGLASGRLDRDREPDRDGPWFWFNLLDGTIGPEIEANIWEEWRDGGWFVGEHLDDGRDGDSSTRISRYHPLKAVVRTTELQFSYLNWHDKPEVLGVAKLKEGEAVVRLDVDQSEYEIVGAPPPRMRAHRFFGYEILPAGKHCRDGIYAIQGFSLSFQPKGGTWHPVIQDVRIVKTFGGAPPCLPVRYVGNGRFAVAKTVKDEVEVPKNWPRDEAVFGAAEAVTLLLDGVTGKVLEQSRPYAYNHNPDLEIPEDWWGGGMRPEPEAAEVKTSGKSLFQWVEAKRELRFAGDKVVRLAKDDERLGSDDGRFMLIYQKCPRGGGKAKTEVSIRILDGRTGAIHSARVESDFYEVWTEASWKVLCSP